MTYIITIETKNASHFEQIKKLAQQFLELQKKYPPRKISKDFYINAIIDEVNL